VIVSAEQGRFAPTEVQVGADVGDRTVILDGLTEGQRSIRNRGLVLLAALCVAAWGVLSLKNTSVDALPDLSDVQVIIRTTYPGQAPQIVENQVTYPLTTTMLSVPGAKTVRGISFFGDSFVYVLFEEGTDLYWARSRVLEYLNQVQGRLPATAKASLGPDATGAGWIFEYALADRTGAFWSARSNQDVRDGRCCRTSSHPGASTHGLLYQGTDPGRAQQSAEPRTDLAIPPFARWRATTTDDDVDGCCRCFCICGVAFEPAGWRIHAAAQRR
jgi:hypothetical protein